MRKSGNLGLAISLALSIFAGAEALAQENDVKAVVECVKGNPDRLDVYKRELTDQEKKVVEEAARKDEELKNSVIKEYGLLTYIIAKRRFGPFPTNVEFWLETYHIGKERKIYIKNITLDGKKIELRYLDSGESNYCFSNGQIDNKDVLAIKAGDEIFIDYDLNGFDRFVEGDRYKGNMVSRCENDIPEKILDNKYCYDPRFECHYSSDEIKKLDDSYMKLIKALGKSPDCGCKK